MENFLAAVEGKKWQRMGDFLADEYSDRWGHNKTAVIDRSREVFAQFFVISLEAPDLQIEEADGLGQARAHLRLKGTGGPLAELAMERVATLQQPFTFEWRQASWEPWDWKLVRVDQPELEVP